MTSPFDTIIQAAETARSQFSILSTEADNAEVLKEMATKMIFALSGLVHSAGGDNDYLESWIDGVADDIDRCFLDVIERREEASSVVSLFRPRPGLLKELVRGANLGGRP